MRILTSGPGHTVEPPMALVVGAGSIGGVVLLVLALVMLATSAAGSCPLYLPVGVDTHTEGEVQ